MKIKKPVKQRLPAPNSLEATSSFVHRRWAEPFLLNLAGHIPQPLGIVIRKWLYSYIFARIGRNVYIQAGCEFSGTHSIELGDNVRLLRDTRINFQAVNSRLRLGYQVMCDRGVDIAVAGDDCLIEIGDNSFLGAYVCVMGPGHIKIGANTIISAHSSIFATRHSIYSPTCLGIEIGDCCWLGSGVKVLDGVKIGHGCVIGAGAVVTTDIPPNSVAVGVPAQVIRPNVDSPFYPKTEIEAAMETDFNPSNQPNNRED